MCYPYRSRTNGPLMKEETVRMLLSQRYRESQQQLQRNAVKSMVDGAFVGARGLGSGWGWRRRGVLNGVATAHRTIRS